ncbi:MAG: PadR family transcriptional regulator [Litorimonas sp.]
MTRARKPSGSTLKILKCLISAPDGLHGYALMKASGLASGTLYPILARLSDRAWLEKKWEIGEGVSGPPRRVYTLTPLGRTQFEEFVEPDALQLRSQKARTAK